MLRIIAVDDEGAALKWFHRIASENAKVSIEGEFLYAGDAMAFVGKHPVDVAFLDIEMPETDGLALAERLMEADPFIKVVFVTAYNQYALDAFRAHALGYLLKPLDREEFDRQIELLTGRYGPRPVQNHGRRLYVKCFGPFSVSADPEGLSPIRWKTAKAEELFALLIHHGGRLKSKESLIETLWPELDAQRSVNLFRVTCTYLRTALADLGFPNLLLRELDGYKLDADLIDCDLYRFHIRSENLESAESLEESAALYSGEYLEGKSYDWASPARTRLESEYKRWQYRLADEYLAGGLAEKACRAMEKVLLYDPYDEAAAYRVVQARLRSGDRAAALKAYHHYIRIVKKDLGISPSEKFMGLISDDGRLAGGGFPPLE